MCLTHGGMCPRCTSAMGEIRGALPKRSMHSTLPWYTRPPHGWGTPSPATQVTARAPRGPAIGPLPLGAPSTLGPGAAGRAQPQGRDGSQQHQGGGVEEHIVVRYDSGFLHQPAVEGGGDVY